MQNFGRQDGYTTAINSVTEDVFPLPLCPKCANCRCRRGHVPRQVHQGTVPSYDESEAQQLPPAKPLNPTKEQLEDLWISTRFYIWAFPRFTFKRLLTWAMKSTAEIKTTDDETELDGKYKAAIWKDSSSSSSRHVSHKSMRYLIVDCKKSCSYHRGSNCYCGKIKLSDRTDAYFNWKAFLLEDMLEFF